MVHYNSMRAVYKERLSEAPTVTNLGKFQWHPSLGHLCGESTFFDERNTSFLERPTTVLPTQMVLENPPT